MLQGYGCTLIFLLAVNFVVVENVTGVYIYFVLMSTYYTEKT